MTLSAFLGRQRNAFIRCHTLPLKIAVHHAAPFYSSRTVRRSKQKSSSKPTGVFPRLVKASGNEPLRPPVDAVEEERLRSSRIKVSYWEARYFETCLIETLDAELAHALGRESTEEELLTAHKALLLLRANPKAYIGYTPYANAARNMVDLAMQPWTPEFRRIVRQGGAQLRRQTYEERFLKAAIISGTVGCVSGTVYLIWRYFKTSTLPRWFTPRVLGTKDASQTQD